MSGFTVVKNESFTLLQNLLKAEICYVLKNSDLSSPNGYIDTLIKVSEDSFINFWNVVETKFGKEYSENIRKIYEQNK